MNSPVNHPSHYNAGASPLAQPALAKLGIFHYDSECIETIEQGYPWLLENSYAFTAVVYLWRCEYKGTMRQDLEKALWFLMRGIDYWTPWWVTTVARAEVMDRMQACRDEVEKLIHDMREAQ